jgi:hypothetical protein
MKKIVPLIVASFVLAIVSAMLQGGPFTLPYLLGYLLGIVVPIVVYSGTLTLVAAGIYRLYTRREMPNLFTAMWGIWVLVAAVIFIGSYQNQQQRLGEQRLDPYINGGLDQEFLQKQRAQGEPASAIVTLQSHFAKDTQQLDAELASKVARVSIPALFDPVFLQDRSRFPAASLQLKDYGQLFQQHKAARKQMLSQMKIDIAQLDLPENEILQANQEFKNTYEIDSKLSEKYFDIVIEVSQQGIAYLDFLQQAQYQVNNGQAMFETDAETDQYQAFLQIFRRLSEQEISTQGELTDSREKRMQRLLEISR